MARVLIADGVTAIIDRRVVVVENSNRRDLLLTATCPHGVLVAKPQDLIPDVPVPVRLVEGVPQVRLVVWQPRCLNSELYTLAAPIELIEMMELAELMMGELPPVYEPVGSMVVAAV